MDMPPPPMPASLDPTTISSVSVSPWNPSSTSSPPSMSLQDNSHVSPSTSFARLSLLSLSPIAGSHPNPHPLSLPYDGDVPMDVTDGVKMNLNGRRKLSVSFDAQA